MVVSSDSSGAYVGNLTNVVYPVSPSIVLAYDPLNRLTAMVDGVGTTLYGYDGAGQVLSEDGPWANDTVSYTYANRLRMGLTVQAPNGAPWSQSYGYDTARRLTGVSSPAGIFGYARNDGPYNSSGYYAQSSSEVISLALPGGAYITNTFDAVAREAGTWLLNSSGSNLDSYVYTYNQGNQRTEVVRTSGDYVNYSYDNLGELKTAVGKEMSGAGRWQEQFGYAYDGAGNLNYRTNNTLLDQFNVNSLNELTTVTNGGRLTVAGSTTSRATSVTVNTSNAVLYADTSFASTNQPWAYGVNTYTAAAVDTYGRRSTNGVTVSLAGTNSYSYDLNGNLLSDGTRNFAYDDENQLIAVWQANAWSNNFAYDGKLRRRIERDFTWNVGTSGWQETNEIHFIYDGNLVIEERNAANLPQVTYTRGNDLSGKLQGAGGIGGLLARTDNTKLMSGDPLASAYYHCDGNGNVTCLMSPYQQIAAKYLYDPYGNTLAMYGSLAAANAYRFSSKEWNGNSGLYYYLYRFYDPNLQRWLNRDPIEEKGGINLYQLVHNDPVDKVDIFGLLDPLDANSPYQKCKQNALVKLANCLDDISPYINWGLGAGASGLANKKFPTPISIGIGITAAMVKAESTCYGTYYGDLDSCPPPCPGTPPGSGSKPPPYSVP